VTVWTVSHHESEVVFMEQLTLILILLIVVAIKNLIKNIKK